MSYELSFRRSDFPIDWNDDVRMNFLFSTFRDRSVNPEGYDAKMNFWVSTIQEVCLKSEAPVISLPNLNFAFDRNHRQPVCLDVVLENMTRQGLILSMSDYRKVDQVKGWLGWSYDVLVQKPVSWGFSSVQGLLNLSKKDDKFIVLSVVKDLAARILKRYYQLVDTKWTDSAVFLEHFKQECKDVCSESNFELAVIYLQREKKAHVIEEFGQKVIKFCKMDENKITPLTELDKGILSLKKARDTLIEDIDVLEENIMSCHNTAKELVKSGLKTKAMLSLKKKKRLETVLQKKSIALDNIENLLCQLRNSGSEKMILEAYRSGVQAMKQSTSGEFELDTLDDLMSDVKGALDDYSEVQNTLARSVSYEDDSLSDFEAELEDILAEDKPKHTAEKRPSPSKVSDDDLLRRLAALRAPPEDVPPVKKPTISKPLRAP